MPWRATGKFVTGGSSKISAFITGTRYPAPTRFRDVLSRHRPPRQTPGRKFTDDYRFYAQGAAESTTK